MSQIPEPPASSPRWAARHKRLLIAGLISFLLLLALAITAVYYIRSGRLNRYIVTQVQTALEEYGVRAEIGGLELAWGVRTADVRDVKLYNQQTRQLIATLDRAELVVEIPNPFALRFRREVIFKRLDLNNLQAYVEIDEQGISNFSGLHAAPPSAPSRITFDFASLVGSLDGGTLHIDDRAHKIAGELRELKANAQPLPGGSLVDAHFGATSGRLRYEGRETTLDNLDLAARAGDSGADIDRFFIRSPLGEVTANGRVDDYNAPRYNFGIQAQAALAEAAKMFTPETGIEGTAAFDGRVEGEGGHYRISGGLRSDELVASGTRARGVGVDDIKIEDEGGRIIFSGRQARASSVYAQGNQLSDVSAGGLSGELAGDRAQVNAQQVAVSRLAMSQGQVAGISLRDVTASIQNGRYQISGGLGVRGGVISGNRLGPVRGQLVANNSAVSLNRFNASLLGGTVAGDVVVQTGRGGSSRLTASLSRLNTK